MITIKITKDYFGLNIKFVNITNKTLVILKSEGICTHFSYWEQNTYINVLQDLNNCMIKKDKRISFYKFLQGKKINFVQLYKKKWLNINAMLYEQYLLRKFCKHKYVDEDKVIKVLNDNVQKYKQTTEQDLEELKYIKTVLVGI